MDSVKITVTKVVSPLASDKRLNYLSANDNRASIQVLSEPFFHGTLWHVERVGLDVQSC